MTVDINFNDFQDKSIADHLDKLENGILVVTDFKGYDFWLLASVNLDKQAAANIFFDALGVPGNLSYKEKLSYYRLLGSNNEFISKQFKLISINLSSI